MDHHRRALQGLERTSSSLRRPSGRKHSPNLSRLHVGTPSFSAVLTVLVKKPSCKPDLGPAATLSYEVPLPRVFAILFAPVARRHSRVLALITIVLFNAILTEQLAAACSIEASLSASPFERSRDNGHCDFRYRFGIHKSKAFMSPVTKFYVCPPGQLLDSCVAEIPKPRAQSRTSRAGT